VSELLSALPFTGAEFNERTARLANSLKERGLDAIVTFVQENQYWVCGYETTGFHSFAQGLIVTADGVKLLVTRQLEIENATDNSFELPAIGYQDGEDPGAAILRALLQSGLGDASIGLEKKTPWLTVEIFEALTAALPGARFQDCSGLIEQLRSVKSTAEVAYMRTAARAVGTAINAGISKVRAGVSEFEIAAAVSAARINAGSHFTRNPTYITSGIRSALGHASWTGRTVAADEIVYFELGANVRHYDAALIRTAVAGKASEEMKDCHAASISALDAALSCLKPGVRAKDVHAAADAELQRLGYGHLFDHRIGYGIGIEFLTWIERGGVSLDPSSTQPIKPNMTLHLIPFFKVPGKFSIGVSETVLVTLDGCEVLETDCARKLFEC
jgi:Xaa-Pro dipeptidase